MAMNEQKKAFANALALGLSNREAAVAAGYSEKTASQAGSRLARDEDIQAEVKRIKAEAEALAEVVRRNAGAAEAQREQGAAGEVRKPSAFDGVLNAIGGNRAAEMQNSASDDAGKVAETAAPEPVPPPRRGSNGKPIVNIDYETGVITFGGKEYSMDDPKDMLTLHMMKVIELSRGQIDSAKALLPFVHGKIGDQGKKGAQDDAAKQILDSGLFAPMPPPRKKDEQQPMLWQ